MSSAASAIRQRVSDDEERLARDVLGQVAGKWALCVLDLLARTGSPVRFTRVLDGVEGITQKVLTTTLRHLERDGFVSRCVYPQVPPRVEYTLTALGQDLHDRLDPLARWARTQTGAFAAARGRFEGRASEAV